MTHSFQDLGINPSLIDGLKKEEINEPTDIQISSIPLALANKDIIGEAQTGSGKTLAYLLPIFQKIDSSKREMQAIILVPTHELAMQIDREIKLLAQNSVIPVTSIPIIGEVNVQRQVEKLREKPHIVVGSGGRILELIKMKKVTAHTIKTIVIDEADRLLDENNLAVVKAIIKTTMRDRQLMLFSATVNEDTLSIAKSITKEAEVVKIEEKTTVNENIIHHYLIVEQRDKIEALKKLVASVNPPRAIVFLNKSEEIEKITSKLLYHNLKAVGIFGSASKEDRKRAMTDFITGKIQLLVASDLAARGLDIKNVTHIFNLDLPEDDKNYLHRVGRTGRAGKKGTAISIITKYEIPIIQRYERAFDIEITEKDIYKGVIVDPDKGRPSDENYVPKRKPKIKVKNKKSK